MSGTVRGLLWNRAVALAFGLPALGYLAFLSQFLFGEPTGLTEDVLAGLFLFALPVLTVYSALLDVVGPVDQTVGTVGFFVFAYLFAVATVSAVRYCVGFLRARSGSKTDSENSDS